MTNSDQCQRARLTNGIVAVAMLFAYSIVTDLPRVERYAIDIHEFMKGTGPQGPPALAAVSAPAIMLIAVAGYIMRKKDFEHALVQSVVRKPRPLPD